MYYNMHTLTPFLSKMLYFELEMYVCVHILYVVCCISVEGGRFKKD